MIACLDVDYRHNTGVAACLVAQSWQSSQAANVYAKTIRDIAPYEPGAFYKRELPCLLQVLQLVQEALDFIIVDSYVWLDDAQTHWGMGAHLYDALQNKTPIIGVAKTHYAGSDGVARQVLRGQSQSPLFVTAIGVDVDWAAQQVELMHGNYRLPTLLKEVDYLCRNF
jgi:deoxyribonuclease V